jgi:hypothetical protein
VASQEKIFTPVGIAITMVAAVKYLRESRSIPMLNMWCDQKIQPKQTREMMSKIILI